MFNKITNSIAYSRMVSAKWDMQDKIKNAMNSTTTKKAAQTACTIATITSSVNAGACVGKMVASGATKKLVAGAAVHTAKAAAFGSLANDIKKKDNR